MTGPKARAPRTLPRRLVSLLAVLLVAAILAAGSSGLRADTVFLEKGGKVRGTIIDESDEAVWIQTPTGVMRIEWSEIRRIDRDEDVFQGYRERAAELERLLNWDRAADGWFDLGEWCQDKGLRIQAVDCYQKCITLVSDHARARARLGYRNYKGDWVTEDEWHRLQGYKEWDGRWVPAEDYENYKAGLVKRDGQWVLPGGDENTAGPGAPPAPPPEVPRPQESPPPVSPPPASPPGPAVGPRPRPRPAAPRVDPGAGLPLGGADAWDPEARKQRVEVQRQRENWAEAVSSRYYDFYTNGPRDKTQVLAQTMDRMFEEYRGIFNHQDDLAEPFVVYLYASQQEFMARTSSGPGVGGFYQWDSVGGGKIQAFHGDFAGLSTQEVLFHEGTHQFEGMILPGNAFMRRAKIWLVEGLAVYFEPSVLEQGRLRTGVIPVERLQQLKQAIRQNQYDPLDRLIRMSQAQFGSMQYAEAWSLIYFFVHAYDGRNRKYFVQYFQGVKEGGRDPVELFEEIFHKPMSEIEAYWKEYVLELQVR